MRILPLAVLIAIFVVSHGIVRADDGRDSDTSQSVRVRGRTPTLSRLKKGSGGWFTPFTTMKQSETKPVNGHVGGSFHFDNTQIVLTSGLEHSPLGVRSSMVPTDRHPSPFFEFGLQRSLFKSERHHVSVLGTYGRNWGDFMNARVGYLEVNHTVTHDRFRFSLHLNRREAEGALSSFRDYDDAWFDFDRDSYEARFEFEAEF